MLLPNRHKDSPDYRYGFNGMESDTELKGEGNSYTTHFRQFDPRIGRWLSIDPKYNKYPSHSPYNLSLNNPIFYQDRKGDDPITAVLESMAAFGLEAGMDFLQGYLLMDKSAEQAFDDINWGSAVYESGKTFLVSSLFSGLGTVKRIEKMRKTKIGRVTIQTTKSMVSEIMKQYALGNYNDENGDFDPGRLFNQEELSKVFLKAVTETLLSEGYAAAAKKLQNRIGKSSSKLAKIETYMSKNTDRMKTASKIRGKRLRLKNSKLARQKSNTIDKIRKQKRSLSNFNKLIDNNVTKEAIKKTTETKIIEPITKTN